MRSRHLQFSLWVLGIGLRACRIACALHYVYSKAGWGGLLPELLGNGLLLSCVATLGYCVKLLGCRC